MRNEDKSIDYHSPIDEDFKDPNWDDDCNELVDIKPEFINVYGHNIIKSFTISNIVVTQKLYETVMGKNLVSDINGNLPKINISWFEAIEFCNRLSALKHLENCYSFSDSHSVSINKDANGYRLPYKTEWIYAAVGGIKKDTFSFSGSNSLSEVGWFVGNSACRLHIVGQKKPNALGLFDMSGNIWEWTNDEVEQDKVACGGCFSSTPEECMILNQGKKAFTSSTKSSEIGFRLVRTLFH